jgi:catalase
LIKRIPKRVVHAKGSGAHGYFELFELQSDVTKAGVLTDTSRKSPVFFRFSTVHDSRGSADKFEIPLYTEHSCLRKLVFR